MKPETFRGVVQDLVHYMERAAYARHTSDKHDFDGSDASSYQKALYGDAWTLLYGIKSGISIMRADAQTEVEFVGGGMFNVPERKFEIKDTSEWQEHYDKYGSGPYGKGLKLGRDVAFYEDRDFTFVEPETEDEDEYEFTFTS